MSKGVVSVGDLTSMLLYTVYVGNGLSMLTLVPRPPPIHPPLFLILTPKSSFSNTLRSFFVSLPLELFIFSLTPTQDPPHHRHP